jgi:hypothetical protein
MPCWRRGDPRNRIVGAMRQGSYSLFRFYPTTRQIIPISITFFLCLVFISFSRFCRVRVPFPFCGDSAVGWAGLDGLGAVGWAWSWLFGWPGVSQTGAVISVIF